MKIKELIKILNKLDGNMDAMVYVEGNGGHASMCDIVEVKLNGLGVAQLEIDF